MALAQSLNREAFSTAYQAIFNKVQVSKILTNGRFESDLSYGQSVKRVILDYGTLSVTDVVNGTPLSYVELGDSSESLIINKNKSIQFTIFDDQKKQAGPLSPEEIAGKQAATFMGQHIDAAVFAEVRNFNVKFDNGDLTTAGVSSGTAITLNSTTVPQLVAQGRAKLQDDTMNQDLTDLVLVADPYGASQIYQDVMSKNIDLAGAAFKNGYAGPVGDAQMYVSTNLSSDAVITMTANPTNGQTFIMKGITFTFVTTIGSTPGNVLIGVDNDATRANLIALINAPSTTTANGVALGAAGSSVVNNFLRWGIVATNNNAADTMTLATAGSGRLSFGGTATYTVTSNTVNYYLGKPKTIDLVIQLENDMEVLRDKDHFADFVRMQKTFGVKLFDDSKHKGLHVKIAA